MIGNYQDIYMAASKKALVCCKRATSIKVLDVSMVLVGFVTSCERLSELQRSIKVRPSGQEEPGKTSVHKRGSEIVQKSRSV